MLLAFGLADRCRRAARLVVISSVFFLAAPGMSATAAGADDYEIIILGSVDSSIEDFKKRKFWGPEDHAKQLSVPRYLLVTINDGWKQEADSIPVEVKKELFYRTLVPLILYANELIMRDREKLISLAERDKKGESQSAEDMKWLRDEATQYRLIDPKSDKGPPSDAEVLSMMDELLVRLDIIPPALALGQAAYESGYGTSRFTLEGNSLFGIWTYGEKGIRPQQQRKSKGDYKVASYDWPLDTVRAYMKTLNIGRTYKDLRAKRAALREQGKKLTGLELAGTLTKYSERGHKYVNTLRGIMKTNELFIADDAVLRDEKSVLVVGVNTEAEVAEVEAEIEQMRASGELEEIIHSMRLDESH